MPTAARISLSEQRLSPDNGLPARPHTQRVEGFHRACDPYHASAPLRDTGGNSTGTGTQMFSLARVGCSEVQVIDSTKLLSTPHSIDQSVSPSVRSCCWSKTEELSNFNNLCLLLIVLK